MAKKCIYFFWCEMNTRYLLFKVDMLCSIWTVQFSNHSPSLRKSHYAMFPKLLNLTFKILIHSSTHLLWDKIKQRKNIWGQELPHTGLAGKLSNIINIYILLVISLVTRNDGSNLLILETLDFKLLILRSKIFRHCLTTSTATFLIFILRSDVFFY